MKMTFTQERCLVVAVHIKGLLSLYIYQAISVRKHEAWGRVGWFLWCKEADLCLHQPPPLVSHQSKLWRMSFSLCMTLSRLINILVMCVCWFLPCISLGCMWRQAASRCQGLKPNCLCSLTPVVFGLLPNIAEPFLWVMDERPVQH